MNLRTIRMALLAATPILGLVAATSASAGGFYLQEQSARGAGRAFSGEGADTGAASLWWNPAAIGGMTGGEAALSASAIRPKGDVTNVNTLIVRPGRAAAAVGGLQDSRNPIDNGILPSGAVAYGITPKLALGLAITSPFSFTTDYEANSWARYSADKTELRTADIQPSIAYMPTPQISLGAALNVEYSIAALSNALPNLSPLLADGHQTLKGDGLNVGFTVGAQYREGPLSVGVSYKSSINHHLYGTVTTAGLVSVPGVPLAANNGTVGSITASFRTPWQAIASARFKLVPALTLNAQVVRIGWKKFDAITLSAPLNVSLPENYRNTWSYAGGVDLVISPALTLRAGVQHDETPTRNGQRDARVPDSDRWNYAGGGSLTLTNHVTVDAAFSYIDFKNATIDRTTAAYAGTAIQTPILVNGRIQDAHALVFSLGGRLTF